MIVGCPTEVKSDERRVGLTPNSVQELHRAGHDVLIQSGAGLGIGADDAAYEAAGAKIVPDAASLFEASDLIVKVKEPQASERACFAKVRFYSPTSTSPPIQTRPPN